MGDPDDPRAPIAGCGDLPVQDGEGTHIKPGARFVEQEQWGRLEEDTGEVQPLRHTAREGPGPFFGKGGQFHAGQRFGKRRLVRRVPVHPAPERKILERGQAGIDERGVPEIAEPAVLAKPFDGAHGGAGQPCHDLEQGGLARAVRADQQRDRAGMHLKRDVPEHGTGAEELSDSGELQQHQFSRPLRRLKLTNGSRHIRMPPIHSQLTSGLELRRNTARFCWSTAIRVA